jgi:hypothetical protein
MSAITSLSALRDVVQALPPVPKGKVRVFRGQTKDYPTIPAGRNRLAATIIARCRRKTTGDRQPKRRREENDLSQSEACRVLNETGIGITLDSL